LRGIWLELCISCGKRYEVDVLQACTYVPILATLAVPRALAVVRRRACQGAGLSTLSGKSIECICGDIETTGQQKTRDGRDLMKLTNLIKKSVLNLYGKAKELLPGSGPEDFCIDHTAVSHSLQTT
jgi:hypothetical protein